MKILIAKIKCLVLTGHEMEKYQSKIVNGVFGKAEAYKNRCIHCKYIQNFWIIKEKNRHLVRAN